MSRTKRTVAIDFDGVLHEYDGYKPGAPLRGPMPGARQACERLLARGHAVVVFTTCSCRHVEEWLEEHGFPLMEVTSVKRPFWVIIDDRAINFDGSWDGMVEQIEAFEPHWIAARRKRDASPQVDV